MNSVLGSPLCGISSCHAPLLGICFYAVKIWKYVSICCDATAVSCTDHLCRPTANTVHTMVHQCGGACIHQSPMQVPLLLKRWGEGHPTSKEHFRSHTLPLSALVSWITGNGLADHILHALAGHSRKLL